MTRRLTVRLDQALHQRLRNEARRRHTTLSALGRAALHQGLGPAIPAVEPSPPGDTWERVLLACPPEVQTRVRRAADRTGQPVGAVMRALLISAAGAPDLSARP